MYLLENQLAQYLKAIPKLHRRPSITFRSTQRIVGVVVLRVPEGSVVSVIQVLPLFTYVLPCLVSHTQAAQVRREAWLIGTRYTALLKETPHR